MREKQKSLDALLSRRPQAWDDLPDFPLYMDQVLSYMERQTIRVEDGDVLTASMVNNYTKSDLVPRADGKKYGREHLAYLTFICVLKQVMSVRDMDLLIREELRGESGVEDRYEAFLKGLDGALDSVAAELRDYPESAGAADAAVHFALLSYAAGIVSRRFVSQLREERAETCERPKKKNKKEHD